MFEDQVTYMYIGAANVAALANGTKVTKASDITAGTVVILDEENKSVEGTAGSGKLRVAQRIGNQIIYGPFFDMATVTNANTATYAAGVEQVSYLGYNGTLGALDETADKLFSLQFILQHTQATINNSPMIKTVPFKTNTALQKDLALGLVKSANAVFSKKTTPDPTIQFEIIFDEAVVATNDFLADATVVKGTKSFTVPESSGSAADAGEYAISTPIAVGDWVRIGTVGGGTALTSSVYRVTAVAGVSTALCTITVDNYIISASGTYAAATSDIEVVASATVDDATAFGIKMTGLVRTTPFNPVVDRYEKVQFDVTSNDTITAEFTTTTTPYEGIGHWEQVSVKEIYCAMNEGQGRFLSKYPPTNYRNEAAEGTSYDILSFQAYDQEFSDITGNNPKSKMRFELALFAGSTQVTELGAVFGL